ASHIAVGSSTYQINTAVVPRDLQTLEAFRATSSYTGTGPWGNVSTVIGFRAVVSTPTSGTWASKYGMYIDTPVVTAGGAITNSYGIRIVNQGGPGITGATGI